MYLSSGRFLGEALRSVTWSGFRFSEVRHSPQLSIPPHTHEDGHFVFVVRGQYITTASPCGVLLGPPRLIFNPPGTTHRDRFASPDGLSFAISVFDPASSVRVAAPALNRPVSFGSAAVTGIAVRLFEEFSCPDALSPIVLEGLTLALFGSAARATTPPGRRNSPRWLARAIELIEDRCCDALTVRDVAREVGVHPYHLARVFREVVGRSPGEVLRECRLRKASRMLSSTAKGIAEIAVTCGYADQSQFARSFQKAMGLTPSAFRRIAR